MQTVVSDIDRNAKCVNQVEACMDRPSAEIFLCAQSVGNGKRPSSVDGWKAD